MTYVHKIVAVLLSISFLTSCKDECDKMCTNVNFFESLIFVDQAGNDLLGGITNDSMSILNLQSLNNPEYEMAYEISKNLDGTFVSNKTLFTVVDDDLYLDDEDTGEFSRRMWTLTYRRSGVEVVDTIRTTPVDRSTKCCISLTVTDFDYDSQQLISYELVDGFPIYKIVLDSL